MMAIPRKAADARTGRSLARLTRDASEGRVAIGGRQVCLAVHRVSRPDHALTAVRPHRRQARRRGVRGPRRRDRHRAASPQRRRARGRRAPVGHASARRGGGGGARRAPRLCGGRLRCHLDEHLGVAERAAGRGGAAVDLHRAGALDGSRAPRLALGAPGGKRRRARGRLRGGVLDQRRRRLRRGPEHDPAARPAVRPRAARSHPAGDADDRAAVAVRHGAVAARHGTSGLAVVSPLPARPVQRVRAALGRPGG